MLSESTFAVVSLMRTAFIFGRGRPRFRRADLHCSTAARIECIRSVLKKNAVRRFGIYIKTKWEKLTLNKLKTDK